MQEPHSERQIDDAVRRGGTWIACAQVASQVLGFLVLAFLYRTLGKIPFGLLGMVLPLVPLVRIFITSGLDVAAVQRERLDTDQLSALFWLNQILGLAAAAVIACATPLIVWFYGEPRLWPITLAMAGTTIVTALGVQHQALLGRKLRLGSLAVLRVGSQAAGGVVAVAVAFAGGGVWALIAQQYIELAALAMLAWWFEPWRPRWRLRGTGSGHLLRFGRNYTISSLMFFAASNLDKILVGFFFGPAPLAVYSQAFNLAMKPVHTVVTPLTGIMLPALSRAQQDQRLYHRLVLSFGRFLALSLLPCGIGLAVVAPEAIRVLGGPEWVDAGPILAVLALVIPLQGCLNALGSVYASWGRADRLAAASVGVAGVLCTAFLLAAPGGESQAALRMALAYTAAFSLIVFPPYLWWALKTIELPVGQFLSGFARPAAASLAMGAAVAGFRFWLPQFVEMRVELWLLAEVSIGVVIYSLLMRRDLALLWRHGKAAVFSLR